MKEKEKCPACGKGEHGIDGLCDYHYKEYLGQHLGSHSDIPDSFTIFTPIISNNS